MSRQHGGMGWWELTVVVLFEGQDLVIGCEQVREKEEPRMILSSLACAVSDMRYFLLRWGIQEEGKQFCLGRGTEINLV